VASRLEARHLQKSYGSRKVVKDVSLAVQKGEVVGLLGPNGAGKTTSFYMIVGLVRADAGEIAIDGQPVEHMPIHRRSRLGLSTCRRKRRSFASSMSRKTCAPCWSCSETTRAARWARPRSTSA
jgi:ABC-type lipopolysaccharide export system ATPase subunit